MTNPTDRDEMESCPSGAIEGECFTERCRRLLIEQPDQRDFTVSRAGLEMLVRDSERLAAENQRASRIHLRALGHEAVEWPFEHLVCPCGWSGSSALCGNDERSDDELSYCPECNQVIDEGASTPAPHLTASGDDVLRGALERIVEEARPGGNERPHDGPCCCGDCNEWRNFENIESIARTALSTTPTMSAEDMREAATGYYTPWCKMSDAPRDGTEVLLLADGQAVQAAYDPDDHTWFNGRFGLAFGHEYGGDPTAWRPLPPLPLTKEPTQ